MRRRQMNRSQTYSTHEPKTIIERMRDSQVATNRTCNTAHNTRTALESVQIINTGDVD